MKLSLFGTLKLVFSMVTKENEDQLDNVFDKDNVIDAQGEIKLTLSDGRIHTITAVELLGLQIDRETIEDVEDENEGN